MNSWRFPFNYVKYEFLGKLFCFRFFFFLNGSWSVEAKWCRVVEDLICQSPQHRWVRDDRSSNRTITATLQELFQIDSICWFLALPLWFLVNGFEFDFESAFLPNFPKSLQEPVPCVNALSEFSHSDYIELRISR